MTERPTAVTPPRRAEPRRAVDSYAAWETVGSCPLCGSEEHAVVDAAASVVACRACGHRYVDPRPTQAEVARGYSIMTAYDAWIQAAESRRAMWQRRYDRVLAGRPPGRLLDVGAGIGTFLAIARDNGWAIEGTEVSTAAVARARDLHGVVLRLGTLEEAGPAGPFDAITVWHVLEHVPDPIATLRACHDRMTDDGRLILAMPNDGDAAWAATSIGNVARRVTGRSRANRYEALRPGVESHIHHFRPGTILAALASAGFAVREIAVDDAAVERGAIGRAIFDLRRVATRITPWNLGREMLVVATRARPGDR